MATTVANPQDVTTTTPGTLVDNNSQATVTNDNLPRPQYSKWRKQTLDCLVFYHRMQLGKQCLGLLFF